MPAVTTGSAAQPLRVLVVNQTAACSGAEHSLLTLLAAFNPAEVQIAVACPVGLLSERVQAAGFKHVPITGTEASFRLDLRTTPKELVALGQSAWQVALAARRLRADVVHANTTRAGLIAIAAWALRMGMPKPLVHVRDWSPPGGAGDLVLRVVARGAGAIIANSQHVADQFGRVGASGRAVVIHNPVDLARFDPSKHDRAAARERFGFPEDAPLVGVVGQLTPWKGQDDAVRALAVARESVPTARLAIAGSAKFSGPSARYDNAAFAQQLAKLPAELGIAHAVTLLGEIDDVPAVLSTLDVLLVPSWEEAFGRVVVEGMAMGLPVIATNHGGPPEIIRDAIDGFLLKPQEPQAWGALLAELLADPARRATIGQAAHAAAARFAPGAHAKAVLAVYRRVALRR